VLLGDIYQADHALVPTPAAAHRMLAAVRRRVPALAERFATAPYVHVHGNHDLIAGPALGAPERVRVPGRFPVLLTHGHQFDPIFCRAQALARGATWFTGRLRAAGLRPVAQWFEGNDIRIKHQRFHHPEGPYLRAARRLLHEHAAHAVVMGHTHVPVHVELPEGIFINTGTCSIGQQMYTSIDTRARTVHLHAPRV
jgi:predicted phosphodiesterase